MSELVHVPVSGEVAQPVDINAVEVRIRDLLDANQVTRIEPPIIHRFTPGLYIREMHAPAGSIIVGLKHRYEHPFVVSQGRITVVCEDGSKATIAAPFTGITPPGTRRMAYIHEDTIWITFHVNPNNLTDPDAIVEIIATHDNPEVAGDPRFETWRENKTGLLCR